MACLSSLSKSALASLALLAGCAPLNAATSAPKPAMLPDRLLTCTLGHIINFDPRVVQTQADLKYDAAHAFSLFLPAIPVRTAPPPDPVDPPEPVNPATRIVSDPDGIAAQAGPGFVRLVDYWPERVELAGTVTGDMLNAIVISGYDPANGTASVFMTHASELSHLDTAHLYQGQCQVTIGTAALAPENRATGRP